MPICQTCGQNFEVDASKVLSNVMSEYVNPRTGKVDCVLNTDEKEVKTKDVVLIRKDHYENLLAQKSNDEAAKKLQIVLEAEAAKKLKEEQVAKELAAKTSEAKTVVTTPVSQGPTTGEGASKQTASQAK